MDNLTVHYTGELQKVDILPTDTMVFHCDQQLSAEQTSQIYEILKAKFPANNLLVLSSELRLQVANHIDA